MKNVLEKASNELSMNGFRLVDPEVRELALRQFGRACMKTCMRAGNKQRKNHVQRHIDIHEDVHACAWEQRLWSYTHSQTKRQIQMHLESGTGAHTYKVCKSVSAAILHLGSASKFRHVLVDRLRILTSKAR
jgi:hypothetical protein